MGRSEEITGLKYDKSLYTDCGFYAGDMDDSYIPRRGKKVLLHMHYMHRSMAGSVRAGRRGGE